jgi:hypothetical protein
MPRVISVHEYDLKPDVQEAAFENALHDAERRGLLELPGLTGHYFLRGLKGARRGAYTAIWIFESREAWERLWGNGGSAAICRRISGELEDLGECDPCAVPDLPS